MDSSSRGKGIKALFMKLLRAAGGLMLFGFGLYLTIRADIGLAPWDVLCAAVAAKLGTSYGNISIAIGIVVFIVDVLLREPIGFGMLLDIFVVGKTVDLLELINLVPVAEKPVFSIPLLLAGLTIMAFAMWLYMTAALGCGPRDSLLVGLGKRLRRLPIGAVQAMILAAVLFSGWLLGGPAGIGTLISVCLQGPITQAVFSLLRFEPRGLEHESIAASLKHFGTKKT